MGKKAGKVMTPISSVGSEQLRLLTRAARELRAARNASRKPDGAATVRERSKLQKGITLMEMLIVAAIMALIAGLSYSPVSAGLETLRLRAASDQVVSLLAMASDRADRKQVVVEIQVLPVANAVLVRSGDRSFLKRVDLPQGMKIAKILPEIVYADPTAVRRFLIYPGGSVPQVGIDIMNSRGRVRRVALDPLTGAVRAQEAVVAATQ